MLSLFALRGARLFFKPLPLRQIDDDGHKMLRERRNDHRRLNLLTIFFHLRVTQTGIAVMCKWNSPTCDIALALSSTTKHILQVVYTVQILL